MHADKNEHLAWCKQRALEILKTGDITGAWTSMLSDMGKHEGTAKHPGLELGAMLSFGGHLSAEAQMKKFIEDFN